MEQVVDTMLHELAHIVHGPHDERFHALWNKLRDEHETLLMKGYTGEGFLAKGYKLGGRNVPMDELRRQARAAAERRRILTKGSGQRLGGNVVPRGSDMRRVIADAVTRRSTITKGCASGASDSGMIAEEASRNGFRTRAEEDDANNRAIAEALLELMEEEEERKMGGTFRPREGLSWDPHNGLSLHGSAAGSTVPEKLSSESPASRSRSPATSLSSNSQYPPERSSEDLATSKKRKVATNSTPEASQIPSDRASIAASSYAGGAPAAPARQVWKCKLCTLDNPPDYLCCDACGVEKTPEQSEEMYKPAGAHMPSSSPLSKQSQNSSSSRLRPTGHDKHGVLGFNRSTAQQELEAARRKSAKAKPDWICLSCGCVMEDRWWTCRLCGTMKAVSN